MKVLILKTKEEACEWVANHLILAIKEFKPTPEKKFLVLGLPTGSTPVPVYEKLVKAYQNKEISFKNVITFNMDEYLGLAPTHNQSYHYFMDENLFNHIDLPKSQIHILDGLASNPQQECVDYEEKIASFGGIDIQLGGIGENGHLAFNEPGTPFDSLTHVQQLTDNTIEVNSRFFEKKSDVPQKALTIGLQTIFNAKEVIVLALGEKKAEAVYKSVRGEVSYLCPASMIQNHSNGIFVVDEAAALKLS